MRRLRLLMVLATLAAGVMTMAVETAPATPTAVCAPAPPSRLILRERARVSLDDPRPLNIRDGAGTDSHVIAQIPANGILYALEGPKCAENYAWYRVEYKGIAGWIAEGDESAYFVEVYPPGE